MRNWINKAWAPMLAIGIGLAAFMTVAWGATYNFYFNNTEQGNNSTATPSVTVTDGKMIKSGGDPAPTGPVPAALPTAAPAPAPVATEAPAEAPHTLAEVESRKDWALSSEAKLGSHHFRLIGAGVMNTRDGNGYGADLHLAWFPVKGLGIDIFGGGWDFHDGSNNVFAGSELEVVPIRLSLGRIEDLLDLGGIIGVSNLQSSYSNYVTIHAGVRANLNLAENWGLTAAIRGNAGYVMGEAGLVVRM